MSGTATNNTDYEYLYGTVTFAAGQDTAELIIQPKDDLTVEENETVILTLAQPSGTNPVYMVDTTRRTSTALIVDNDVTPTVWIEAVENAVEGRQNGRFMLKRDNTSQPLTVNYTVSGTTTNNTDYEYLYGTVTFAAGQSTAEVVIRTIDDTIIEINETVILTLTQPAVIIQSILLIR
jgi:hypothetical protein